MDAYALFYIDLPPAILAKMKHQSCGHRAVLKAYVQTLGRHELHTNVLKSALLHWHVLHVVKLVLAHSVSVQPKRPYATDGVFAQELRIYQFIVE